MSDHPTNQPTPLGGMMARSYVKAEWKARAERLAEDLRDAQARYDAEHELRVSAEAGWHDERIVLRVTEARAEHAEAERDALRAALAELVASEDGLNDDFDPTDADVPDDDPGFWRRVEAWKAVRALLSPGTPEPGATP